MSSETRGDTCPDQPRLYWSALGCFRSGDVNRSSWPANVGSMNELRIASRFAAYFVGVKVGVVEMKNVGCRTSLQYS